MLAKLSPSGNKVTYSVSIINLQIEFSINYYDPYNLLLVARIAYDILSKEAPDALAAANKMLDIYAKSEPSMVSLEGDYPFVECATFADEIKSKGGTW